MEFICKTVYDKKSMTTMAKVLRKTIRAKSARRIRIFSCFLIALLLLSSYLSWGNPWRIALYALVIVLLLLVTWKEDALNGFFAKRAALPGMDGVLTTFRDDCYEVQLSGAISQWQYDRILILVETQTYLTFVLGRNHAQIFDKTNLEGGTLEELRLFLEEKTEKQIQHIDV